MIRSSSSFESAIAPDEGAAVHAELEHEQHRLAELEAQIAPVQAEMNQLSRQFWVSKKAVKENKYDLSASRYRQTDSDGAYFETPKVTLERLKRLEHVMTNEISELFGLIP